LNTNHLLGTPSLYGSEGRNQLRLPSTTDTNVSLFKEFALPTKRVCKSGQKLSTSSAM